RRLLAGHNADLLAGGHVHQQFARRAGAQLFVNPGSVGLSYDGDRPKDDPRVDPFAAYAIVDSAGERVAVELHRVPFDPRRVAGIVSASGIPRAAETAAAWLAAG